MFLFFAFGIFNFFLNLPEIFGKIAMCGVVGIERIFRGFGILPNKQNAAATDGHFTGTAIRFLCLLRNCKPRFQKKGRKGMERKRIMKNGHIVVKNPLAYELPKREVVIKSGRTLYRFTGSYDGQRALPSKVLRLMGQDNLQKDIDKKDGSR